MSYTVNEIAVALGAKAFGATDRLITRAAEPAMALVDDLALAMTPKYAETLSQGSARAAMLWEGADWEALGLEAAIIAPRPRFAMSGLTKLFDRGQGFEAGIHPSAFVHPEAELAQGVSVGPLAVISKGAKIGAGSVIGPQCFIGWNVTVGPNAYLREAVSIGARATIGEGFIAQPGARIGGDGFSFVTEETGPVENVRETLGDQEGASPQDWLRIHSLGTVRIGNDVEIGMGATIDSGTIRDTVIGDGCKLDNQVHVGHNVRIGRNCLICGQVGIAGSATIGHNVVLGGQCGVNDNIFIGDGVVAGGATKLMSSVPAGRTMLGYPATQMDQQIEQYKAQRRLPRLIRDVAELKKLVFKSNKDA